ncbi:U3 small nucleolar RNA-associated protein 14 homolog A [Pseudochaenichthys georgianus]|uniref:U3 small nucleolar RNA-associated protein 14 homolog A n=1 Tax=Pseudochaenichthys georgianus TaxID=52239 RepID=UPI00146C9C0C|nr:U3 small nucleolar RNA-associated protein 14 homolog A [Pseudochaenichthys georgianus]
MAKVSKKKVSKKSVRKSSTVTEKIAEVKPDVVYDDGDDEFLSKEDGNISSEEEEEEDGGGGKDERKRQKLLEAISALGGKRQKKLGERSEAAVLMSEFTINAEGEGDKIDLSDLIGSMEKTSAVPAKTKKQLKNLQHSNKTIECPLSKQESERIQRDVAFRKASTEVTRWKDIIKQNQRAEQLVFPLEKEPTGPRPMERMVTGWKAQTPLEQEIFALLSANKQPINDPILTPAEEASMRAMSLEEAKIRRAELQKARALQSYYEAKTRRERKIKSKKYHKVQNKAKRKEFLKKFEEMVKTDPAAALEELSKIELARMQERMSLKHQNSGKWAKSKVIMAKYDEGARKAMQQQLEVNKELTQKLVTALNREEEEEEEAVDEEVLPDFVNDAEQGLHCSNPWMRGKLSEDPAEKELSENMDLITEGPGAVGNPADEEEEEEEVVETEEETLLREFDSRRKRRQAHEAVTAPVPDQEEEEEPQVPDQEEEEEPQGPDQEEEELSEFTSLLRGIADSRREAEMPEGAADSCHTDPSAQLEEGLLRVRTLEDMELLGQPAPATEQPPSVAPQADTTRKRKRGIELKEVLTKETKVIKVPLAPTMEDTEDSEDKLDQRGLIKEAFAGDDVVSDFLKDKRKQEDAAKPQVVDLTLPGWGEWGGTNLKPSRNKRRRFRIKAAPPPPRRDQCLPSIIMSEKRNSSISLHQVNSLPFPFQNHAQFESTIRAPLGRTWNTEQTVRKISKPKVVTQLGAIIEPMSREELLKDRKQVSAGSTGRVDSWKRKR